MTINPLISQYLDILESDRLKTISKSHINQYLKWRNVPVKTIISNGLQEQEFFDRFLADKSIRLSEKSRTTRILVVKNFLRFHGVPLKKYAAYQTVWFYEDDPVMKQFLVLSGNSKGTKKNVNRFINHYCKFRNKSPSELIEEAKTISKLDLKVLFKEFYDSLEIKTKKNVVSYVRKFYKDMCDIHIDLPPSIKPLRQRKISMTDQLIDKEIVQKLLAGADIRDSLIILACFESGANPSDLVTLNYGQVKDHLNLENPESIDKVAIIPHIRQKTDIEFLLCFGPQTLQFMSKWLNYIGDVLRQWKVSITDDFPIFTMKKAPYDRLKPFNISMNIKKVCEKVGLEKRFTTGDFRNSFNTRTKSILKHYDKELFMGHVGGIERHYDISDMDYFTNEYTKAWKILFNLHYDDVKMSTLEDKVIDQELLIQDLKKKIDQQAQVNEFFYKVIAEKIEKNGLDNALDDLFPKEESE